MPIERLHRPDSCAIHNEIVTITGVSSSGKDFLVNMAASQEPQLIGQQVALFSFGSELAKVVALHFPESLTNGRDSLKNLHPSLLEEYIEQTIQELLGLQPVLQLTHIVVNQQGKLVVNPKSEETTLAKAYIYVWADPALIYSWRMVESFRRQRPSESIESIDLHQEIALATTTILSRKLGAGMFVVNNTCQDAAENAAQINEIVRQLLSET